MSNSSLVTYTKISPNSSARTSKIDTITIHHMAGDLSIEACGAIFAPRTRYASSNYGVGTDGRIGLYVDESRRAWTSSNWKNDDRAVTIEVANDSKWPDWHVSDKALEATIALCVDICKRNDIPRLNYTGWKDGNLTMHKWFMATLCPGPYLESKFPYIAEEVNRRLNAEAEPSEPVNPEPEEPNLPEEETPKVEDQPTEDQLTGQVYCVQIGAYSDKHWADLRCKAAEDAGFKASILAAGKMWRVQAGAFKTKDEATQYMTELKKAGFIGFVTVTTVEATPESEPNPPEEEKPKEEEQLTGQVYRVQIGAYAGKYWAELRCKVVEDAGFKASVVGEDKIWRVLVGAFKTKNEANQHMAKLKKAGFNGFVTVATL